MQHITQQRTQSTSIAVLPHSEIHNNKHNQQALLSYLTAKYTTTNTINNKQLQKKNTEQQTL